MRSPIFALVLALSTISAHAGPQLKRHNSRPLQAESEVSALLPWETPIEGFFVRSHHEVPVVDPERWQIVIDGLVEKPLTLTLGDLARMPKKSLHAVLECSGNGRGRMIPKVPGVQWERGAVGNAEWSGVSLAALLERAKVKPGARFGRVIGADEPALPSVPPFVRSIPLDKLMRPDTLLATEMNREPMPPLHGGPLRLILPGWYGQNWLKWVTRITLTDKEESAFYMAKGYRMPKKPVKPGEKWDPATGNPIQELRVQSLILVPADGETIGAGPVEVRGKAFSGAGSIRKVEISIDGGKHWQAAETEAPHADGGWQAFQQLVVVKKLGRVAILTRATDSAGNTQPMQTEWNPSGYLRHGVDQVTVQVVPNPPGQGESLLASRCLTCHTGEMIAEQRLTPEAWDRTITKMEKFGAKLSADEHKVLVKHLSQWGPDLAPAKVETTEFAHEAEIANTRDEADGDARRGAELYTVHCASCHGADGVGALGPRLKGRLVTRSTFFSAVLHGRNVMPSFGEKLKAQQIADIRTYLNQPVNTP